MELHTHEMYKHYWETEHAPRWSVVAKLLLKSAKIKMSF